MYYICVYILQILQLGPVAGAREMLLLQRGLLLLGVLGGCTEERAGLRQAGRAGLHPWVTIPGRICMSLQAMRICTKS